MSRFQANALLLLTAAIWGAAFIAQQTGMRHVGPATFTGLRFLMGGAAVLLLALWRRPEMPPAGDWLAIAATGSALGAAALLQQVGVGATTVSNAAFLTGLYVPLVPLLAFAALGLRPHPALWPAGVACLMGTWLLSGGGMLAPNAGDLWVIASSFFWALHVLLVGAVGGRMRDPVLFAALQFLVCGTVTGAFGLATEETSIAGLWSAWPQLAFGGLVSVGLGFTFQVVGQRYTPASHAAVILSSEGVFAAVAGALMLGERLGPVELAGAATILSAILVVQLVPRRGEAVAAQ
jgi:drug/metabolite transporter (DMT)-like permease